MDLEAAQYTVFKVAQRSLIIRFYEW